MPSRTHPIIELLARMDKLFFYKVAWEVVNADVMKVVNTF